MSPVGASFTTFRLPNVLTSTQFTLLIILSSLVSFTVSVSLIVQDFILKIGCAIQYVVILFSHC